MTTPAQRHKRNHRYNRRDVTSMNENVGFHGNFARRGRTNRDYKMFLIDEKKLNESLHSTLVKRNMFESPQGNQHRKNVLDSLEKILNEWSKSLSDSSSKRKRVALCTFGSYRLGVHRPDSDIDCIAVATCSCSRKAFFSSLVDLLRKNPAVADLHPVP